MAAGGQLGELTADAATHLGVAAGLPLIAAAGDKQAEALGAGAVTPEVAALSFGTTATIGTTHRRYLEAIPLLPPYPAAIPGAWLVELQVLRGMSQGKSNGQIGRELYLSEDTVKTHARRLFRKLGVRDRAQAVAHGFRRGLVS